MRSRRGHNCYSRSKKKGLTGSWKRIIFEGSNLSLKSSFKVLNEAKRISKKKMENSGTTQEAILLQESKRNHSFLPKELNIFSTRHRNRCKLQVCKPKRAVWSWNRDWQNKVCHLRLVELPKEVQMESATAALWLQLCPDLRRTISSMNLINQHLNWTWKQGSLQTLWGIKSHPWLYKGEARTI